MIQNSFGNTESCTASLAARGLTQCFKKKRAGLLSPDRSSNQYSEPRPSQASSWQQTQIPRPALGWWMLMTNKFRITFVTCDLAASCDSDCPTWVLSMSSLKWPIQHVLSPASVCSSCDVAWNRCVEIISNVYCSPYTDLLLYNHEPCFWEHAMSCNVIMSNESNVHSVYILHFLCSTYVLPRARPRRTPSTALQAWSKPSNRVDTAMCPC